MHLTGGTLTGPVSGTDLTLSNDLNVDKDVTIGGKITVSDGEYYSMDILGDAYLYQLTNDTSINSSKDYYIYSNGKYEKVEEPDISDIDLYFEKTGPQPGHGIAFGMPAEEEGMHIGYPLTLGKGDNEEMSIRYHGPQREGDMIRFIPNNNDINGDGVVIGGGGTVVIGAGDNAGDLVTTELIDADNGRLFLASDIAVHFRSNYNNPAGIRKA